MRKKLLIVPFALVAILALLTWGCEKESDEDVCSLFDPSKPEVELVCEIANVCCPTDGGACYYVVGDSNYYCDKSKATPDDPDGCNEAENQAIVALCPTATYKQLLAVKVELNELTKKLLQEARTYSVCH